MFYRLLIVHLLFCFQRKFLNTFKDIEGTELYEGLKSYIYLN